MTKSEIKNIIKGVGDDILSPLLEQYVCYAVLDSEWFEFSEGAGFKSLGSGFIPNSRYVYLKDMSDLVHSSHMLEKYRQPFFDALREFMVVAFCHHIIKDYEGLSFDDIQEEDLTLIKSKINDFLDKSGDTRIEDILDNSKKYKKELLDDAIESVVFYSRNEARLDSFNNLVEELEEVGVESNGNKLLDKYDIKKINEWALDKDINDLILMEEFFPFHISELDYKWLNKDTYVEKIMPFLDARDDIESFIEDSKVRINKSRSIFESDTRKIVNNIYFDVEGVKRVVFVQVDGNEDRYRITLFNIDKYGRVDGVELRLIDYIYDGVKNRQGMFFIEKESTENKDMLDVYSYSFHMDRWLADDAIRVFYGRLKEHDVFSRDVNDVNFKVL